MSESPKKAASGKWLFIAALLIVVVVLGAVYGYTFLNSDRAHHEGLRTTLACPECDGEVNLWNGITSPKPHILDCPDCEVRLFMKFEHFTLFLIIILASFFLLCVFLILLVLKKAWRWTVSIFVLTLVYYSLLQFGWWILLFNYAEVIPVMK